MIALSYILYNCSGVKHQVGVQFCCVVRDRRILHMQLGPPVEVKTVTMKVIAVNSGVNTVFICDTHDILAFTRLV